MGRKDPRVDAYLARSGEFARPILRHLRDIVHRVCPDVEETLQWGTPTFMYEGILCNMAAFKRHAVFGFWKQKLMDDPHELFTKSGTAMGSLGRITNIDDLPSDTIITGYIEEAMRLNEQGVKTPSMRKSQKKPLRIPAFFKEALAINKKALTAFEALSPSHKREYLEWIMEAKKEETRNRRMATTIKWLAEGKTRNWKYER